MPTNDFPDDGNFPLPSFIDPVTPPDIDPDSGDQVSVEFSPAWIPVLQGALSQLMLYSTWSGDDAAKLLATARANMLRRILADVIDTRIILAPFWDDTNADDASNQALATEQVWYGLWDSGTGFVDSLAGFVFTGFIAQSFGVGAAVSFATALTRFRLAFRTHDTGGVVNVLMDGDLFGTVDTYSPTEGVRTLDIISPGSDLLIVNTGTANVAATATDGLYSMELIRKRLSEDEVSPSDMRWDSGCDCVQVTVDGGATWTDNPGLDARHADAYRLPPLSGVGHECDAAARIVALLKQTLHAYLTSVTLTQAATAILEFFLALVPGVGWAVDLIIAALEALVTIGVVVIEAAFTDAVWQDIECIISCHIGTDGQLSAAQAADVMTQIRDTHSRAVYDTLLVLFSLYGEVMMSNAVVEGTDTGDCSGCDACGWCYKIDFTVSDGGFTAYSGFGTYVAGVGWQSIQVSSEAYSALIYRLDLPIERLTFIGITVGYASPPAAQYAPVIGIGTTNGSSFSGLTTWSPIDTPNPNTYTWTSPPDTLGSLYINPVAGGSGGHTVINTATIKSIVFRGTGDNPFGADNC